MKIITTLLLAAVIYGTTSADRCNHANKKTTHCPSSYLNKDAPLELRKHYAFLDFNKLAEDEEEAEEGEELTVQVLKADMFSKLGDIEELSLEEIGLETIEPGAFRGLENLTKLSLSYNKLGLGTVESGAFEGLDSLKTLIFNYNQLKILPANLFQGMPNLIFLDLQINEIEEIDIQAFAGLEKLSVINLNSNKISEIKPGTFENLSSLTQIDLGSNNIGELVMESFKGLEELNSLTLDNNNISNLPDDIFHGTPKLNDLSLINNHLKEIGVRMFANISLEHLSLEQNKLSSFPESLGKVLSELKLLILDENEFTTLKSGMFDGFANLKRLFLSRNHIETIENEAFRGLDNMELCFLTFNDVFHDTDWEQVLSHAKSLTSLLLSPENFHCDEYEKIKGLMTAKGGYLSKDGREKKDCIGEAESEESNESGDL